MIDSVLKIVESLKTVSINQALILILLFMTGLFGFAFYEIVQEIDISTILVSSRQTVDSVAIRSCIRIQSPQQHALYKIVETSSDTPDFGLFFTYPLNTKPSDEVYRQDCVRLNDLSNLLEEAQKRRSIP